MTTPSIRVKRVYDPPLPADGTRVLVDRLWPRGLSKERAELDEWLRAISPSTELRTWYAHVPERFPEFVQRYAKELEQPDQSAALLELKDLAAKGPITLLTATKDVTISEATVLADILRG
jgi:uncharacterized protein YeaO (DUF488 family)